MKNKKIISCILAVMLLITAIPIMASAEYLSHTDYTYECVAAGEDDSGVKAVSGTTTTSVIVSRMQYAQATSDTSYQFGVRIYYTKSNVSTFLMRFDIDWDGADMTLNQGNTSKYTYANATAVKNALIGEGLTIAVAQNGTEFVVWTDDGNGKMVEAFTTTNAKATAVPQVGFGIQETVDSGNIVKGYVDYFDGTNDVNGALAASGSTLVMGLDYDNASGTLQSTSSELQPSKNVEITPYSNKTVIVSKLKYVTAKTDQNYKLSAVRVYRAEKTFYTRFDVYRNGDNIQLLSSAHNSINYTYKNADAVQNKLAGDGLTIVVVHSGKDFSVWTDDGSGNMVKAFEVAYSSEMKIYKFGFGIVDYGSSAEVGDSLDGELHLFDGITDIHGPLELLKGSGYLNQRYQFDIADYRGETHSHPDATGYVFGGWYSDAALTTPIDAETVSGYAYAKWVDNDVLTVKVQFSNPVVDVNKKTIMRIVTSVDSGDYNEVGFDVSTTNASKTYKDSDYFTQIVSKTEHGQVDFTYAPTVFHETSTKFATVTLYNLKATDTDLNKEFTIKPFWVTPDGTVVYGITRTVTIQDGIDATSAN